MICLGCGNLPGAGADGQLNSKISSAGEMTECGNYLFKVMVFHPIQDKSVGREQMHGVRRGGRLQRPNPGVQVLIAKLTFKLANTLGPKCGIQDDNLSWGGGYRGTGSDRVYTAKVRLSTGIGPG